MDFLQSLLDSSSVPAITAFILGILTAVSPCPLATNITAIGFISKDIENRHRIFINGLLYTFGRIVTYTVLGFILIPILREGASMFMVQKAVSKYGEMLIAPVLIIIGIFMLDIIKLNLPKINIGGESLKKKTKGGWGAMLLGVLFALAFCPTSGCTTCNNEENRSKRVEIKQLIAKLKQTNPEVEKHIFKSVENVNIDTVIAWKKGGEKHHFLDSYDE